MLVSIYGSYGTFCKPLPVGCFQKFRSYSKCCVTVMRFNLRDKVVLHVAIRAMRPRHCVGGGATVILGRRRAAGPKKSARRWRPKHFFQRFPKKFRSIFKIL